ncbi:DNA cytosine methyltransferase [Porphyromonas levii]|uniref:DNA cytosine methyltransferase n=1 Tax=Porphyromonas levii TaxID=28114 RepID=UPI001BACAC86|nr:DNA cytosine methyltransferase [Porphyromonas levii]MBR8766020.1 hypothetical protein [Porphyromonas levii]MBR8773542.1 hypothetical protein [Porphyromonas levii]MBR8801776.1 hypothetical protein [Porphyromonas levii]
MITHGSLFSGIGGFDLAAKQVGWTNVFNCEINPICRRVLDYHFPEAEGYENIAKTDFRKWEGKVDVLSGGFPCQPFSLAGQRKGEEDHRYLWPEMLRAIEECKPTWIVGENVVGILSMVQSCETIEMESQADLFGEVYSLQEQREKYTLSKIIDDLEDRGYSVQTFVIPAVSVGAPHRRDRVWIVAHTNDSRTEDDGREWQNETPTTNTSTDPNGMRRRPWRAESYRSDENQTKRPEIQLHTERLSSQSTSTDPNSYGSQGQCNERPREGEPDRRDCEDLSTRRIRRSWEYFPTQSPVCGRDDGIPRKLDAISFSRWRAEAIKAYGNAIVPQVAFEIFRAINIIHESEEDEECSKTTL